jgi:hypothetical protein
MNNFLFYQRYVNKQIFVLFAIVITLPLKTIAQTEEAYSKINLEINFLQNKPSEFLNRYWHSKYGLQGLVSTPFYLGKVHAGVTYYSFNGREEKYPDFKGFFIFAGWGKDIMLPLKIIFCSSIRGGTFLMHFNVDSLSAFINYESEFAVNLNAALKFPLTNFLRLNLGGEFTEVFLHNRIKLLTAFGGLEYSFPSPAWLKEFFE